MTDFQQIDQQLDTWIAAHSDEIVAAVQSLIHIPSTKGAPAPDAPFGAETRRALDNVLAISERYGFANKMLDGYAAHAEFGQGDEIIGVLSHVDVVPAGSDWKHDPWGGEIEDGKIYGRGAIDDKGPTIAGLYALIAVKEVGAPVNKRLRHILGADEESGFGCMHYYFDTAKEEMPTLGFTPDGKFPAIYAEKGIASPKLSAPLPTLGGSIRMTSIVAGERSNMVPDRAEAHLAGPGDALNAMAQKLQGAKSITTATTDSGLSVRAVGIGAHASMPHEGVNAVALLTDALLGLVELAGARPFLTALNHWAADNSGEYLGIAGSDAVTGPLTSNLGVVTTDGDQITASFSIRQPVTWTEHDVRDAIEAKAKEAGFELSDWGFQAPLHVPLESPLISTLLEVYRAETGDMSEPATMGGGTYARVLKHGVAFGPNFPGFPDNAHQADEYWTVEDLLKATRIYAKSLARLAA